MALNNLRVLELAGLAPGPFTGLLLADYGASVLRIDKHQDTSTPQPGRPYSQQILHQHILIDPFRPGVLEKLGLSPSVLCRLNPRLIVARLTGFRRDGKYASMAGHDLNYLAVSGILSMLGPSDAVAPFNRPLPPSPPGNILGDFAGGGLTCFAGILIALVSRAQTGKGQIVEANMVDGVSYLGTAPRLSTKIPGQWDRARGENLTDGGCPYYAVYECKDDGKYMAVAALEDRFFAALAKGLDVGEENWGGKRDDRACWPALKRVLQEKFRSMTRAEWEGVFDGTDACCTPVLTHAEMEASGYEQRAAVMLTETPSLPVEDGWTVKTLQPGYGGEKVLQEWLGWRKERDYIQEGWGLVKKESAKL
ncbi:hypothetical protein AWENTII_012552 [Aspergillus wentii]